FSGGTLRYSANNQVDYSSRLSATANAYRIDTAGQSVTFATGLTANSASMTKLGLGSLTLTANNTFAGNTTVTGGTLRLGSIAQFGSGAYAGAISLASGSTLQFSSSANQNFSGVISGSGNVFKDTANSALTLTGSNTYTGLTRISVGVLNVGAGGTTGSLVSDVLNNALLVFDRSNDYIYSGSILGSGAVSKQGIGVLSLTGTNTYGGDTTVTAGTLKLDGTAQLSSGAYGGAINIASGTTFQFSSSVSQTLSGVVSGTGSLVKDRSASTLTLTGANTFDGNVNLSEGTLRLGEASILGSLQLGVQAYAGSVLLGGGTTLAYGSSADQSFTGVISGAGSLLKDTAASTLTLTAANTYTGDTTVSTGALQVGAGGTTGSLVSNLVNNATVIFNRSDASSYAGVVSRSGVLSKDGAGVLSLTGMNSYTGETSIVGGTVKLDGIAQLGLGAYAGAIRLTSGTSLQFSSSAAQTLSGVISGTGNLLKDTSNSLLTLTGANTFDGNVSLSAGTLRLGGASILGSLQSGVQTYAGTVSLGAGTSLTYGSSADQTFTGVISGAGSLLKDLTASSLTLTAANTYTGGTTVSAGTLRVGAGGTTGSLVGDVVNNATVVFNRSDTSSYAGVISGSGAVSKDGAGVLSLTGVNTYAGATNIASGAVKLDGAGQIGSGAYAGAISLASGTTLQYSSSAAQTLSGVISGTGSLLKDTAASSLTLTGANTFDGNVSLSAGTLRLGAASILGSLQSGVQTYAGAVSLGAGATLAYSSSADQTFT
ncbi:autotransporter-associated beta strand repeat-containing protein, partial [Shewanella sp.]|uniref:autotransporter-associated beta strand repeat-containing protein n=1 Tax=Shewanella sp. TaxID=50422 RepID=UPI0040475E5E